MTSLSNVSDEYLVQQFVHGDLKAFDSLYYRHIKTVYKRVYLSVPEEDVEDVTQEVFLAVLTSLPNFNGEAQFITWLHTVINNRVASYHRKRFRKKEPVQVDLAEAEEYHDAHETRSPEELIDLKVALNNLPPHYREVILLRFVEGMNFNDITVSMKKSIDSTKMIFRRAMQRLYEYLDVKSDEEKRIHQ